MNIYLLCQRRYLLSPEEISPFPFEVTRRAFTLTFMPPRPEAAKGIYRFSFKS